MTGQLTRMNINYSIYDYFIISSKALTNICYYADQEVPAAGVDQPVDASAIDVPQQICEEWEEEEEEEEEEHLSEMNSLSSVSTVTSDENTETLSDMAETLSSTDSDKSRGIKSIYIQRKE